MIEISQEFKQAVYAPIRKTAAKVSFEILDNEAYLDNTSTVSSDAEISRRDQLTNKVRSMSHKYATFEQDYFKLDGSFHIPPRPEEDDSELGWWSDEICGSDGMFAVPQTVEFDFAEEHSSLGLTVHFDILTKEHATDFDIDVYRHDGTLIHHESVTRNTLAVYVLGYGLDGYGRMLITIRKWGRSFRRAKITEVDFGVVRDYENDKLIELSVIEQMNIISDTIPSNELKFTVDNSDRAFNILNPEGFHRFLKERQEVTALIGIEIEPDEFEYIEMGKYYLTDWQSNEGALTTTFTARNIFELLERLDYISGTFDNLYVLTEDVLNKSGIESYVIDETLRDIPTYGFDKILSIRKALQYIGIAGKCAVYQDRQGILRVQQFKELDESTSYLNFAGADLFAGWAYPEVDEGFEMKNISFDNVFQEPQIKLDKLVNAVEVIVYNYDKGEEKEILKSSIEINGEETVFVVYQNPVFGEVVITVSGATNYRIVNSYTNGVSLFIKATGTVEMSAVGSSLVIKKIAFTLTDNSIKDGVTLKLENPLIVDPEHARDVGLWLLKESRLRALYQVNWRQNPALECGDIVLVEDSYKAKKQSRITKQEFKYSGYLSGKSETKGGV